MFGSDPALMLGYAPSGLGKTTDLIYSAPCSLFLAQKGALRTAQSVVGYEIHPQQVREVATLNAATELLPQAKKAGYESLVLDDFSLLVEQTFNLDTGTGFQFWRQVRDSVLKFRDTARKCGLHVFANAHEQVAKNKDGKIVRGGPKLPSDLPESMPAAFDMVLRVVAEKDRPSWPAAYVNYANSSSSWVTKDRFDIVVGKAPMNLREILRAAGIELRRPRGYEWMDSAVDKIAAAFLANAITASSEIRRQAHQQLVAQGKSPLHARWVIRDAFDRATLKRQLDDPERLYRTVAPEGISLTT